MATHLLKETSRAYRQGQKTFIVTLNPDATITFREKGKRTRFTASLAGCYNLAMITQAEQNYKERMENYNRRKKLGVKGIRCPKRPTLADMFNPKYRRVINRTISATEKSSEGKAREINLIKKPKNDNNKSKGEMRKWQQAYEAADSKC